MYQFNFSDEDSEEIVKKATKLDELFKSFADIDKKFDLSSKISEEDYNKKLDLKRQEFEKANDEEVKKEAENSLHDYKTTSKNQIENEYLEKGEAIDKTLTSLSGSKEGAKSEIEKAYKTAKDNASNDAIKRGLARSSIIVNKLAQYDESYLNEFTKIEKNYADTVSKLDAEKNLLEVQRQSALDNFDISYAVKLSEKIEGINEKLDAKEKEVIEYNNKIQQLEKEFELEQQELKSKDEKESKKSNLDLLKYISQYGSTTLDRFKEQEKYSLAYNYLMSLPKGQAIFELEENSNFKNNLKTLFTKLQSEIKNRKN